MRFEFNTLSQRALEVSPDGTNKQIAEVISNLVNDLFTGYVSLRTCGSASKNGHQFLKPTTDGSILYVNISYSKLDDTVGYKKTLSLQHIDAIADGADWVEYTLEGDNVVRRLTTDMHFDSNGLPAAAVTTAEIDYLADFINR